MEFNEEKNIELSIYFAVPCLHLVFGFSIIWVFFNKKKCLKTSRKYIGTFHKFAQCAIPKYWLLASLKYGSFKGRPQNIAVFVYPSYIKWIFTGLVINWVLTRRSRGARLFQIAKSVARFDNRKCLLYCFRKKDCLCYRFCWNYRFRRKCWQPQIWWRNIPQRIQHFTFA